jgi:hypothetical protein
MRHGDFPVRWIVLGPPLELGNRSKPPLAVEEVQLHLHVRFLDGLLQCMRAWQPVGPGEDARAFSLDSWLDCTVDGVTANNTIVVGEPILGEHGLLRGQADGVAGDKGSNL